MKIFIIPATYNEKDNIRELITIIEEQVIPKAPDHDIYILVADDNSPDGTADVVRELMKKNKNLGVNQGPKKGLGAAYVRVMGQAFEEKGADAVISIDADLQHDPLSIPDFINKFAEGYDVVIGTRYSDGGSMPSKWPFRRKLFSVTANILMRIITGRFYLHDWTGGFRMIGKEAFLKEKDRVRAYKGYTFQVAFLYKAAIDHFKIGEVPIHFRTRTAGDSKIAPLEYIINVLSYVIRERIKEILTGSFGKFLVVGGTGFVLNAIILRILVEGFGWVPYYANLVGAVFAIFSNYNFNNLWTFKHHKHTNPIRYVWKMMQFYATSSFGVIFIQTGTIYFGVHYITHEEDYFYYFLLGTFFLMLWNFTVYSKLIWRKKKH